VPACAALSCALALVLVGGSDAASAGSLRDRSGLFSYLAVIERYRAGEAGDVAEALSGWHADELKTALEEWRERLIFVEGQDDRPRGEQATPLEIVATAMVAHLDAARRIDDPDAIADQMELALLVGDFGIQAGLWSPDTDPGALFLGRWHLLAATVWFGSLQLPQAARHLEIAQSLQPENAAILLALGSLQETYAAVGGEPVDAASADRARETARHPPAAPSDHLEKAARLYEAALIINAGMREARLRYARVLSLLGELDAAAREVSRVPVELLDPYLRYQGLLITGAIDEARGRFADATDRYRAARDLCRGCQSATFALSHALVQIGDEVAALEIVDRALHASPPPPDDPWWVYLRGQWQHMDAMLAELRDRVPR
jgi:tetratricopeptide (TPR) repeat protein